MMSHSDPDLSPLSGFTLLEALMVLTILSFTVVAISVQIRPLSPELQMQSEIANLNSEIAQHVHTAVETRSTKALRVSSCDGKDVDVYAFRDGTVTPASICVQIDDVVIDLNLHPFLVRWEVSRAPAR